MQIINIVNGLVKWIKPETYGLTQRGGLVLQSYEIIDENAIRVSFENLGAFCFFS